MRRISTYGGGRSSQVADVLQGIFVAELIAPSPEIWIVSPWVSDIPVVDNRGGEFSTVVPGASVRNLSLVDVLIALADSGTMVHIVMNTDASNHFVLTRLQAAQLAPAMVDVHRRERIHEKGLLTSRVYLSGSMNFTFGGQERNEEGLTVDADPEAVARMFVDFAGRFASATVASG